MSRLRHADVVLELVELGNELRDEVRQQLLYYRASVYKHETAAHITQKIENLRLVTKLFNDGHLLDIFHEYDLLVQAKQQSPIPGECSMSFRVARLLDNLGKEFTFLQQEACSLNEMAPASITRNLVTHRRELLAICKHGSRSWNLLQNL